MNKFIRGTVAAVLATAPVTAFASDRQTGDLSVTTTISVSCDSPSPSGTLNLPFDSDNDLDAQALANTPVTVTVTCYGNPLVNHVEFDNGEYREDVSSADGGVRYMLLSGVTSPTAEDYLGYKLWANLGDSSTSSDLESSGTPILTGGTTEDNWLDVNGTSATFQITGQVYEGSRNAHADAGAVPGGTYRDTVEMTVDYN